MSQPLPCGRATARWSVLGAPLSQLAMVLGRATSATLLNGMVSMAGLPFCRAIVWVGPPLLASGPNIGFRLDMLWLVELVAVKLHDVPLSML